MKNYTITVNGNVYDVTVEETGSTSGAAAPSRQSRRTDRSHTRIPTRRERPLTGRKDRENRPQTGQCAAACGH